MTDEKIHEKLLEDIVHRLYKLGPVDIPEVPSYEIEKPRIHATPRLLIGRLSYSLN